MSNAISWRLYVIVDAAACGQRPLADVAEQAIRGGADVIQLRNKSASKMMLLEQAKQLLPIAREARVPLIINDHVDVAVAAGADGVHLGQEDLPVREARKRLGPDRIIGQSTHDVAQAIRADLGGADYLALGPIYPTPTKPAYEAVGVSLIEEVKMRVGIPIVCIGGITQTTLPEVVRAGATCVAVVRAVCAASDPAASARALKSLMTHRAVQVQNLPA